MTKTYNVIFKSQMHEEHFTLKKTGIKKTLNFLLRFKIFYKS